MTTFLTIFRIFLKILQKLSEGQTIVSEHFRKFLKIAEDFRGRTDDVAIMQEHRDLSTF